MRGCVLACWLGPGRRLVNRCKDAYETLHPKAQHGGDRASRQLGDLNDAERFTADTATKTGQSERAVQRDAKRGVNLPGGHVWDTGDWRFF